MTQDLSEILAYRGDDEVDEEARSDTKSILNCLMTSDAFPDIDDVEEALEWAKIKRILADAEKVRVESIRARTNAVRQLIEVCRLLFKMKPEERKWVMDQLEVNHA